MHNICYCPLSVTFCAPTSTPPRTAMPLIRGASALVIRCFRRVEVVADVLTGAAGPVFIVLAWVLTGLAGTVFCESEWE